MLGYRGPSVVTSRLVLRPFTEVDRAPFFALNTQAVMERIGMTRDAGGDFDHPALPDGSPLRRHVLYRISAPSSQLAPSVPS